MNTRALWGPVTMGPGTVIGEHCTIGYPKETRLRGHAHDTSSSEPGAPVLIGARCVIFNQVVIYEGVRIGDECVVEDRIRIGYDTRVGVRTRLAYGTYVCDRASIGVDARVAGFVCDAATIGDRATMMGDLVHEYTQPHRDWWETDEEAPVIEADTIVGFGARVVGGVHVGPRSYVTAGAVVTRDVLAEHVVTGVNRLTPAARWPGHRLQGLIRYWQAR